MEHRTGPAWARGRGAAAMGRAVVALLPFHLEEEVPGGWALTSARALSGLCVRASL